MMDKKEAIEFLKRNQPLPDDEAQLESIISIFDDVRKWFLDNPDSECVPLFLNCFSAGNGFGVYQLIEDVMVRCERSVVISNLKIALFSHYPGVRYWCAQIASRFDSDELLEGLLNVYEIGDIDSKCAALTALSGLRNKQVLRLANRAIIEEKDELLIEIAQDILDEHEE